MHTQCDLESGFLHSGKEPSSKNWAVCTCAHCTTRRIYVCQGSNKTTECPPHLPLPGVRGSVRAILWCCAAHAIFLKPTHLFPLIPRCSGSCDTDLTFTVLYLLCLSLWTCCSRCHSYNMWIKLSLTHPLRKGIQVQACHVTLLPGSLSMIKLILWPCTRAPESPISVRKKEQTEGRV